MKSLPPRLYKYESFNERSLQNLKAQSIYFASPSQFNDPYDCALEPTLLTPGDDEAEELRKALGDYNPKMKSALAKAPSDHILDMTNRLFLGLMTDAMAKFRESGVSCFSEECDNLLMWSHYGGRYRGFCLEFDTRCEPLHLAVPVTYSSDMPTLHPKLLFEPGGVQKLIRSMLATKSSSWAYEKEWRILTTHAGITHRYATASLTGVYFGPEISREALEIVCLILQGQNTGVKFWQGSRSKTEFKVEFEEVDYVPYVDRSGLVGKRIPFRIK